MSDKEDFAALLREFEHAHTGPTQRGPKVGEKVHGTVVSIGPDRVFIDLGGKSEGVMDAKTLTDGNGELTVHVGDAVEVTITRIDESSGTLLLGTQHGQHLHDVEELEDAFRNRLPVEGHVTGVTKGGVEVQIAGQRAFCPASQIDIRFVEDMESFVDQRLSFLITKFEGGRRVNLVVSRRALLEEQQQALAVETRARLDAGAVLRGTVTSIKDFGAFVDLGGVEGMVHVSELAYGRVKHPSEVLSVGQQIEVAVLRIDKTGNPKRPEKIALSIRALADNPWQAASQRYPVGARVEGTITRLQTFGAFVELEPGIEGLVHISELGAGRRISHPREVVSAGQEVEATVLAVDSEKRRISLSLDNSRREESLAEAVQTRTYQGDKGPEEAAGSFGDLLRKAMNRD